MPRNWLLSIAGLAGCSVDRRMEGMVRKKGGPAVRIAARMPGFRALRAESGIWRAVSRSGGPQELALNEFVVRVRADDGGSGLRCVAAARPRQGPANRRQ